MCCYCIDALKRILLLENSGVFTSPVLSHARVCILPMNWKVWRPKGLNFTKSSFYKHFSYQIRAQGEALLTKSLLSLAACSCSWSIANRFYLWFHPQVWACFIGPGESHPSGDYEQQESWKTRYNSKADCNNGLSTFYSFGEVLLLLKYLAVHIWGTFWRNQTHICVANDTFQGWGWSQCGHRLMVPAVISRRLNKAIHDSQKSCGLDTISKR